jgi:hypothetical protein
MKLLSGRSRLHLSNNYESITKGSDENCLTGQVFFVRVMFLSGQTLPRIHPVHFPVI